jgi:hypothetical protein
MKLRSAFAAAWLTVYVSAPAGSGQTTPQVPAGTLITGPSPWIDVSAPPYYAACNGTSGTDDTVAIQTALNVIAPLTGNPNTGMALYIPPTSNGCYVKGITVSVKYAQSSMCSMMVTGEPMTCLAKLSMNSRPNTFGLVNSLVNIHNVTPGIAGTNFNGTFVVVGNDAVGSPVSCSPHTGYSNSICYYVQNNAAETGATSPSTAVAEIGLYFNGNNLRIIGAALGSGGPSPSGSMLVTNSAITILTTYSSANPGTGPDIQNVTFWDALGNAFAGLNIGNTSGFNVSNDGFYGFSAGASNSNPAVAADPQAGAGIEATAGQPNCGSVGSSGICSTWVQFGKIENNRINARLGFTSKFNLSSVTFDSNTVNCPTASGAPEARSIALDIGGLWYLSNGSTLAGATGGENRVINQQSQGCLIGVLLGSQNNDRVEAKLENGNSPVCTGSSDCAIGLAVLNTQGSTLYQQSKYVAAGLYIDPNSPNNAIYENAYYCPSGASCPQSGKTTGSTLNALCASPTNCPSGSGTSYSFNSASLVIDPSAPSIAAGTSIFGTPPLGGSFSPTLNSSFTRDNAAAGLNVTVAATNVALSAHGDANSSDVFDAYTNTAVAPFFSIGTTAMPTVGNSGYITAASPATGFAGTNYVVGDVVKATGGGSNGQATFSVATIGGGGAVSTLSVLTGGSGYSTTSSYSTTGGSGTGLDITPTTVQYANGSVIFDNGSNLFTTTLQPPSSPTANAVVTLPLATGTLATTLDTVGNLAATATNTFAGTSTWTLSSANTSGAGVTITNTGSSSPNALVVSCTGSATCVPEIVNENAPSGTGDIMDLQVGGNNKYTFGGLTAPVLGLAGGATVQATNSTGGMTFQCGHSASNATACLATLQGADSTGNAASTTGGDVLVRGGNIPSSSTTAGLGGYVDLEGGACTSSSATACQAGVASVAPGRSAGGLQGLLQFIQPVLSGGTNTANRVECWVATAMEVTDCPASAATGNSGTFAGVALTTAAPFSIVLNGSFTIVKTDNATTIGHTVCFGTMTPGEVHDNLGTAACGAGAGFGVVIDNSSSHSWMVPNGQGGTVTLTAGSTTPLVHIQVY